MTYFIDNFEQNILNKSDLVAIRTTEQCWAYTEINRFANQWANYLKQ